MISFFKYHVVLFLVITSCVRPEKDIILLYDDYQSLHRGPLGSGYGAHTEYHYYPEASPKGNWAVSTFRYNLAPSWYVRKMNDQRVIYQKGMNTDLHWHPMIIAGNNLWKDF